MATAPTSTQPTATDAAAPADAAQVLRILTGLHAGASRSLAAQEMILIGSGDDCDIVLADSGVSRHHALINIIGSTASLRALDAPLRVDGAPLVPGDPVELRALQRVQLGDASIAFASEADAGWSSLLPMAVDASLARPAVARSRRLPAIAALAVLSLVSVAIFAAVMPHGKDSKDAKAALTALMSEFHVSDGQIVQDVDGNPVLRGTVDTVAVREHMRARLQSEGVAASLDLRTGERIAQDVREVLRGNGLNVETRYLGNGDVELGGALADAAAIGAAANTRAAREVPGVRRLVPKHSADLAAHPAAADAAASPPPAVVAPLRIVAVVRGDDPHVVAIDGTEYRPEMKIPGVGRLAWIGSRVKYSDGSGALQTLAIEPLTPTEVAAAAEKKLADQAAASAGADTASAAPAASTRAARPAAAQIASSATKTPQRMSQ